MLPSGQSSRSSLTIIGWPERMISNSSCNALQPCTAPKKSMSSCRRVFWVGEVHRLAWASLI